MAQQSQTASAGLTPSHLLELPPELRNRIYRFALVEKDSIELGNPGFTEPPLLMTSKQIRAEAIQIFHIENNFIMLLRDFDVTKTVKWRIILNAARQRQEFVGCTNGPKFQGWWRVPQTPHWKNLMKWLGWYHFEATEIAYDPPSKQTSRSPEDIALGGLFVIVEAMKGQPWDQVKGVVEKQRFILANIDARWNVDHA